MIWINPDQRKLQRILWRENMDEPIKTFELSTVTYGTTSAPFLATRTLKQLALDEAGNFPLGSSVVMSDMYIDVLTGAETLLEAKELKNQLINIFAKGDTINREWRQFVESLQVVNDININRCIVGRATGSDRTAWSLRRVPVSIWSCQSTANP
ncbi:integrase catalytic domain-containing protein [Trichonephila clavipes]|nr:integrase catalytic domain-containing protein [Trichonephila clavipes]